ncbi:MAG: DJ-1/PfpI family protein [Kiloniellales bacterium]|nr:DJ-1/PfpI family protein [Kiloniellales bacterium]
MTILAIIAFDGFTDLDVFLHWDLLNRPRQEAPERFGQWRVRLLGTAARHRSTAGLEIEMQGAIDEAREADAVLHASGPATRSLAQDRNYLDRLSLDPARQLVASQCSGALVLAASGLLEGKTATTYPTARAQLEGYGVTFLAEPFVAHERIATAAGCLAGVELDRWLLSKLADPEVAAACIASASPIGQGLELDA